MNTRSHIPLRIRFLHAFAFVALCGTYTMADTNFVQRLYETWAQHDAQALLEFVETSVATNPCLETITAQGLVYGFILGWGAASTNLFEQAKTRALTVDSSRYTEEEKAGIIEKFVSFHKRFPTENIGKMLAERRGTTPKLQRLLLLHGWPLCKTSLTLAAKLGKKNKLYPWFSEEEIKSLR